MTRYEQRFTQVLEYIEANPEQAMDMDKLSAMACLSRFHFHRLFSDFLGMSVMSLGRLLRLKRAAYQLAYRSEMKIIDIALASGYQSHEAFSRAFRQHFALSPVDFRLSPDWSAWQQKYAPVLSLRNKIMQQQMSLDVEVVNFPETPIAVLEHRGSPEKLGYSIQNFIQWRKANGLPPSQSDTFNLLYEDPALVDGDNFRFDLCCAIAQPVEQNALGVKNAIIPAGKCAKVRHIGSDDGIGELIHALYNQWLDNANYALRDFPLFLQRVRFFPEVTEKEAITDIYLPLV